MITSQTPQPSSTTPFLMAAPICLQFQFPHLNFVFHQCRNEAISQQNIQSMLSKANISLELQWEWKESKWDLQSLNTLPFIILESSGSLHDDNQKKTHKALKNGFNWWNPATHRTQEYTPLLYQWLPRQLSWAGIQSHQAYTASATVYWWYPATRVSAVLQFINWWYSVGLKHM